MNEDWVNQKAAGGLSTPEGNFNATDALLPQAEQAELNALRKIQADFNRTAEWTTGKKDRFLELQGKEDLAKKARK